MIVNASKRAEILAELQSEILRLEGFKPLANSSVDDGLGPIKDAMPNASFPLGALHEFLSSNATDTAATTGFISGLIASLMNHNGACLWISTSRKLFPPALKNFGIEPHHFIFIDLKKENDVIWTMDEALKCSALKAVVCELSELSFTASRRLQLAVEHSKVTGFIIRHPRKLTTSACISRWKISSLPSQPVSDLPGVGFPKWKVELLRIRNGKPGSWNVSWSSGFRFHGDVQEALIPSETQLSEFDRQAIEAHLVRKKTG